MYDVVIGGAGPAGSTAAYYLARQGQKVALIDRQSFPRNKPCGGGLCVHITDFDHIVSNWDRYLEATCYRGLVYGQKLENVVDYPRREPFFYNIRRQVFDNALVNFATDAGAELFDSKAATGFQVTSQGVTTTLRDGTELKSRAIIGAGGTFDMVAQRIREIEGFPMWGDKDLATALVAEIEVGEEYMDETYGPERASMAHVKFDGVPGYGWVFSKRSMVNIGIGSDRRTIKRMGVNVHDYFTRYVKVLQKQGYYPRDAKIPRAKGSNIPVGTGIKCSVGDRMLVAGDAGGFVSPLSGEGIYYAIDSGRLAAQALEPLLESDRLGRSELMAYHNAWRGKWGWDLWWLKRAWQILMFMPNKLVRYASWDQRSKELFTGLFLGSLPASKHMHKIVAHILKDVFKYDLFQWHRLSRGRAGQGGRDQDGSGEGADGESDAEPGAEPGTGPGA